MGLITAAELKQHWPKGKGLDPMEDDVLDALIDRADDLMASYLRLPEYDGGGGARSLTARTYTLYFSNPSKFASALCLGVRPVSSVTSVNVDPDLAYGAGTEYTEGTDFFVDTRLGHLGLIPAAARTWPAGWRAIRVVCVAGYAKTPPGLVPITAAAVQSLLDRPHLQQKQNAGTGGTTVSTTDLDDLLPAAVRAGLDRLWSC